MSIIPELSLIRGCLHIMSAAKEEGVGLTLTIADKGGREASERLCA